MDSSPFDRSRRIFYWATTITLIFAVGVILLGAYTRLSDAGLGCPDWPGCYGKLVLPKHETAIAQAQQTFPHHPIIISKAWKEMTHRYSASLLGLLVFILAVWSVIRRRKDPTHSLWIPGLLIATLIFQMVLGMWTVTMKVNPIIVVGHLIGGMMLAVLLCWLRLNAKPQRQLPSENMARIKPWVIFGLILLAGQIFLGGWTSTNYAALACPSFPLCHGSLFPQLFLTKAFNFIVPIGPNYEGGHLVMEARITIQMVHRYGAFIITAFWLPFSVYLIGNKTLWVLRPWGWMLLALLATQCVLGILNVVKLLPMSVAVSHNGIAVLFLITVVALLHKLTHCRKGYTL